MKCSTCSKPLSWASDTVFLLAIYGPLKELRTEMAFCSSVCLHADLGDVPEWQPETIQERDET